MKRNSKLFSLGFLLFFCNCRDTHANLSLPSIFSDGMVLQQNAEMLIWGWGKPLENVSLVCSWDNVVQKTVVSSDGQWELKVMTPRAGGPFHIKIEGYNELEIKDVLVGEVWLCSGQSNMEWGLGSGIDNAEMEIKNANYPLIRTFNVLHRTAAHPQIDLSGSWQVCSPETAKDFSAVAYFFARKLQQEMNIPIGIINASWGGTPAEVWIPKNVVQSDRLLDLASKELSPIPWGPYKPGRAFNAMIAPITPFKIAGALWYQGEGNTQNAPAYKDMFSALIRSWREEWGYQFPFYYAQIAPFRYGSPFVGAVVRDAQRRTLEIPNTGMVVTSDIGDTSDIHPKNKQDVGRRMAMLALKGHYKKTQAEVNGPLFNGMDIINNALIVYFAHAEGLHFKGGDSKHFEVAGADGMFYPAKANVKGNSVVLTATKVKKPEMVRFAWSNTATPNLFNAAGLPASCFLATR